MKYIMEETCEYPFFTMTESNIRRACEEYKIPVKIYVDDGFDGVYVYYKGENKKLKHNNWRLTYFNGEVVEFPFFGCTDGDYGYGFDQTDAFDGYDKEVSMVKFNSDAPHDYDSWKEKRLHCSKHKLLGTGLVSITDINTGEVVYNNPHVGTKMSTIEQAIKIFGLYDVYKYLSGGIDTDFYWEDVAPDSRSDEQRHKDHAEQRKKVEELITKILLEDGVNIVDKSKRAEWEKYVKENISSDDFEHGIEYVMWTYAFIKELDGAKDFEMAKELNLDLEVEMAYLSPIVLREVERFSKNGAAFVAELRSQNGHGENEKE